MEPTTLTIAILAAATAGVEVLRRRAAIA